MSPQKQILLTSEKYEVFKTELAQCEWFFRPEWSLFALAQGGHSAATVDAAALNSEIKFVWRGSPLPFWARPFGIIVAAYGGVTRVTGLSGLQVVCDSLLCMSSVEFLIVHRDAESSICGALASLGREARALRHVAERSGVVGVIWVDDDQDDLHPIIYQFADGVTCPLLAKFAAFSQSPRPTVPGGRDSP